MKRIPAILFCLCLFVPETARVIAGNFCAYTIINEDASPVCACMFNNVPAEMAQTSFPDKHKEILQQTDWQYIAFNHTFLHSSGFTLCSNKYSPLTIKCPSGSADDIFHPPLFT